VDGAASDPVNGVFWLPGLDCEDGWMTMSAVRWHAAVDVRVKALYRTMRARYDQIAERQMFLISATRLGGYHGYDEAGAFAPLGGAVTGFTKAYKRERPEALIKAVDFEAECTPDTIADLLVAEALRDPGALEVGYAAGMRWTVGLDERPVSTEAGMTLDRNTVFVITGAAGSIVAAITADLAAASGGTFHLLDVAPAPDPSSDDLKRFTTDREGLKRDLFARMQSRGERATPAMVERELAALERAHAAFSAMEAVRSAGGTVYYYSVDLRDGKSVAEAITNVRERSGRVDVLLHAAGMDRSHALRDKDEHEYNLVFDVKSDGIFHLLHAIGDMPLGAVVGFSSIAGRFGNVGQTDYSAANDLLCKLASNFRGTHPETRALAIDWTAWAGIGMASRGSIPKIMQMAGIEMLPPEAGVPWIRRELTHAGGSGEVVVAMGLGALAKPLDESGGVDPAQLPAGPMIGGAATARSDGSFAVETTLDPAVQPFLKDHAIEGTPLLPGVMGIEAFAESALAFAPGWNVAAVEDVDFLAPFKFYRSAPRAVTVELKMERQPEGLAAKCALTGQRQLAGQDAMQTTVHFTGRVRLAQESAEVQSGPAPVPAGSLIEADNIYRVYFHGPAYRVIKRAWWSDTGAIGEMAPDLPDNHVPIDRPLAIAPRLIELCFQTAGLWEMAVKHRMGLPRHVGSVRQLANPDAARLPLYAVVTPEMDGGSYDADVVDAAGTRYLELRGYRTVTFSENIDERLFAPLEAAAV
jgi:NADP-dependent 3-hydroxy acid dehydrogenase YdfG